MFGLLDFFWDHLLFVFVLYLTSQNLSHPLSLVSCVKQQYRLQYKVMGKMTWLSIRLLWLSWVTPFCISLHNPIKHFSRLSITTRPAGERPLNLPLLNKWANLHNKQRRENLLSLHAIKSQTKGHLNQLHAMTSS